MNTHPCTPMHRGRWRLLAALGCVLSPGLLLAQSSSSPAQIQQAYEAAAGTPAQAERGRAFFVQRHGGDWSCASCHGNLPTAPGRHAVTGKPLGPLAPAFNPKALSDARRVEKWLRRNCTDVLWRECSPGEKADVLAWLRSLS